MERIILNSLLDVLNKKELISPQQFGFRKSHSASHLLLEVVNDWAEALEDQSSCHCLFLDFAKAFDSVPHQHLQLKLESIGITVVCYDGYSAGFLTSQFQQIIVNGKSSNWLPVLSGVPQRIHFGSSFIHSVHK